MKERPILFSGQMVRALLAGTKTQTRRIVKNLEGRPATAWTMHRADGYMNSWSSDSGWMGVCPYGQPGDRLWVRENFQPFFVDGVEWRETDWKTGDGYEISYPATDGIKEWVDTDDNLSDAVRPSIHMPRWASRILLEITNVRVQRLQDISEEDARAEGCGYDCTCGNNCMPGKCNVGDLRYSSVDNFIELWNRRNGNRGHGWEGNPWVWAATFRRIG